MMDHAFWRRFCHGWTQNVLVDLVNIVFGAEKDFFTIEIMISTSDQHEIHLQLLKWEKASMKTTGAF